MSNYFKETVTISLERYHELQKSHKAILERKHVVVFEQKNDRQEFAYLLDDSEMVKKLKEEIEIIRANRDKLLIDLESYKIMYRRLLEKKRKKLFGIF